MCESRGHIWSARHATAADAAVIAKLVERSGGVDLSMFSVALRLAACLSLRILFWDGAAVGICGIGDVRAHRPPAMPDDIQFQGIMLVGDWLAPTVASEAADRLVRELALGLDLPDVESAGPRHFDLAAL